MRSPKVRMRLPCHEPLLIQGRGGRFLSHQKQRRSFDLLQIGAAFQRIEVCLEAPPDGGRRPVLFGDVPVYESLKRHPGVQPVVNGGVEPSPHAPAQGVVRVPSQAGPLPARQSAGVLHSTSARTRWGCLWAKFSPRIPPKDSPTYTASSIPRWSRMLLGSSTKMSRECWNWSSQ